MNILTSLRLGRGLTDAEKSVADTILADPERFLKESTRQLSQRSLASQATVYRLCEKLGCSGLAELKVEVSGAIEAYRLQDSGVDVNFPVVVDEAATETITNLAKDLTQSIAMTANATDPDALERAANLVCSASQIDIFTSAGSVPFAESFRFQMQEVGRRVVVPLDEYDQRLVAASADDTHVAIVISFGGRSMLSEPICRSLIARGIPVILLASADKTPLDEIATIKLALSPQEHHCLKVSNFATGVSILYVLDVLYARVFVSDYDANLDRKLSNYGRLTQIQPIVHPVGLPME